MLGRDGGRADHDLGAVGLEHVALVLADLVGAHEDAVVALLLGHHRQPDAGVAGGRLDDRAAGLELAGRLGRLDHPRRDAVLHRPAGVEVLDLGEHQRACLGGRVTPLREVEGAGSRTSGVLPIRSRREFTYCTRSGYPSTAPERARRLRSIVRVGATGAARKLASAAAYGGGGLSVLGAGLYGVLVAEARFARKVIGVIGDDPPPDATGWYGRGRPGPAIRIALLGDSSAAGYGVDRVEETPGAQLASGVAEQADRRVYLRSFAVVGAMSSRPGRPGRPRARDRPRRRRRPDRRQRRHPHRAAVGVGAPPRRGRTPPARGRHPRGRRHLPRPRHHPADPAAAQAGGPGVVAPAGGRPDDRRRRERRPHGLARRRPGPGVRRRAGPALRPRPVPPLGRRLRAARLRAAALGAWPPSTCCPRTRRSPSRCAARASCRSRPRPCAPRVRPAPRSTAPRSAATSAACAGAGSSCATAAVARRTDAESPGEHEDEAVQQDA